MSALQEHTPRPGEFLPYFSGAGKLDDLKAGAYVGQPAQRYLKIAWGHGKDVAGDVSKLKATKMAVPVVLGSLEAAFQATKGDLDAFITGLPVDGYLGDVLDTPSGKKLLPALAKFCTALVSAWMLSAEAGEARAVHASMSSSPNSASSTAERRTKTLGCPR